MQYEIQAEYTRRWLGYHDKYDTQIKNNVKSNTYKH